MPINLCCRRESQLTLAGDGRLPLRLFNGFFGSHLRAQKPSNPGGGNTEDCKLYAASIRSAYGKKAYPSAGNIL